MYWQNLAEIHSGSAGGLHGSGYLLAPGLLLTAGHVVHGLQESRVRLLEANEYGLPAGVGDWQTARVAWVGDDVDLALLAPAAGGAPFREPVSAAAIARLGGREPVRVDALGFPRAVLAATHSDTLHLEATINAWSSVRGEALLLDVRTTRPATADGWKGMSGAAVFAGDRLVGVIEAVPARLDDSTLRATPAYSLADADAAMALLHDAEVAIAPQPVDAAYVDALPRAGHWSGVREAYTRAVVTSLLRIDRVGLAIGGAPDRSMPALAAFSARLRLWRGDGPSR
jgi:hypothetical protein